MAKKAGRPTKGKDARSEHVDFRLTTAELRALESAADLAGLAVASWCRSRLLQAARKELVRAGRPVP